jgi:hypothetical protein
VFVLLQSLIGQALTVLAFGLEVFALVDALRTRADAFAVAGKLTKNIWVAILGVAAAFGFITLPLFGSSGRLDAFGFLSIVAVVAAIVYLADVRPAVKQLRGGGGSGGSRSGPYGPW